MKNIKINRRPCWTESHPPRWVLKQGVIYRPVLSSLRKRPPRCWFTSTEGTTWRPTNASEKVTGRRTEQNPPVRVSPAAVWTAGPSLQACPDTVGARTASPWRRCCRATTSRTRTRRTACVTRLCWSTWTTMWVSRTACVAKWVETSDGCWKNYKKIWYKLGLC